MSENHKFHGIPVVRGVLCEESNREPVKPEWVPDKGLILTLSYNLGTKACPIALLVSRETCKEMVKDLIHEIESE